MASAATRDLSTTPSAAPTWQRTEHAGVYVRHRSRAARASRPPTNAAAASLRTAPRDATRGPEEVPFSCSGSYPDINEALTWLAAAGDRAAPLLASAPPPALRSRSSPTSGGRASSTAASASAAAARLLRHDAAGLRSLAPPPPAAGVRRAHRPARSPLANGSCSSTAWRATDSGAHASPTISR